MPKMKTHKGSKKRFRVTASGKLKRQQATKRHLLAPKAANRKRRLRKPVVEAGKFAKKYITMLGGKA